jgi:hypothetical protein
MAWHDFKRGVCTHCGGAGWMMGLRSSVNGQWLDPMAPEKIIRPRQCLIPCTCPLGPSSAEDLAKYPHGLRMNLRRYSLIPLYPTDDDERDIGLDFVREWEHYATESEARA